MTSTEQQALAQARARIDRNLAEIAGLSRDGRFSPSEFFGRFLPLTLEAVDAMGGAVWLVENEKAVRVAEVSFASCGYGQSPQTEWIDRVLGVVVGNGKPCVVAVQDQLPTSVDAVGNAVPYPFFYTPVVLDGRVSAVLQVWLKHAGDPRTYTDIAAFLDGLGQHACLYLRGFQQRFLQREIAGSRQMLEFQEVMLGELDPRALAAAGANYCIDLLPCALGAVMRRKAKRWDLIAASNQETIDPAADQSQALARLAAVLPESLDARIFSVGSGEATSEGFASALEETGYRSVAWCHFRPSKNGPVSHVLLGCWHEPPADPEAAQRALRRVTGQLAKAMDAATHFHHIPLRRTASAGARVVRAWKEDRRRRVLTFVILPAAVVLGALLYPAPYKIKADCSVVPERVAMVVAETAGKIVEVPVAEGAEVSAGQILARLEDTDYATQIAAASQQLQRFRVEAMRAQTLGNEPERKISELAVRREEENIRRLEYLRSRTELRSPIDGTVLTRNVQQRVGEAMDVGKIFCEVGSQGDYDLQLDIRQQDMGTLLRLLSEEKNLPVDFILHAHAKQTLQGELGGPIQVSQLPQARASETVFTARIPFPAGSLEGDLKAGYTGKASISLGRRPWGWLLLRPFRQYWRMNWSL
jgi:multidrug efflux pump subunit AcrA (membrane-fusion protein)